jgi:hypothetical protein
MARISQNPITSSLHGAIGKNIVFRTRNGKTFASKYPDMSRVKLSASQKKQNTKFAKAVAFAQSILNNPAKKAAYKLRKKGQSVYHAAIQEYYSKHK